MSQAGGTAPAGREGGGLLQRIALAAVLAAVMAGLDRIPAGVAVFGPARLSVNYGFLLLEAFLFGGISAALGLPRLSGYILAGILFGPDVLGYVSQEWAGRMRLIDDLALTFIALTAGAELRVEVLRARGRAIAMICAWNIALVWAGVGAAVFVAGRMLPFPWASSPVHLVVAGALLGAVSVARSPTSAIAIINECRARGPFTDTVFGVTVAIDTVVILLFAVTVSVGGALVSTRGGLDLAFLGLVAGQLVVSVALGAAVGWALAAYARRAEKDLSVILVVLSFLITETARWVSHAADMRFGVGFHLEPLLMATAAGFVVQNFTDQGERLNRALHAVALPIFVVFFSMAGVALDLGSLKAMWVWALGLVLVRAVTTSGSSALGAWMAGESGRFAWLSGLTFLTQAGVSLGLAQEIGRRFPGWGGELTTLLVAGITVNQVVGPVTFKLALDRIGESGRAADRNARPGNAPAGAGGPAGGRPVEG